MPEVIYHCYFDEWELFMDGDLIIGDTCVNYDFVSQKQANQEMRLLGADEHGAIILNPFTEEEAKKHFAAQGYTNIKFIYEQE